MNTHPPFGRGFGLGPVLVHQQRPTALDWVTFALVVLLVLATAALLMSWFADRHGRQTPALAGASGTVADPLDVLRIRYARGEIGRDEFVQATHDLVPQAAGETEAPTLEQPPG